MMATNPLLGFGSLWYDRCLFVGSNLSSVPGLVGAKGFSYMQMVLGYQVGYFLSLGYLFRASMMKRWSRSINI